MLHCVYHAQMPQLTQLQTRSTPQHKPDTGCTTRVNTHACAQGSKATSCRSKHLSSWGPCSQDHSAAALQHTLDAPQQLHDSLLSNRLAAGRGSDNQPHIIVNLTRTLAAAAVVAIA